MHRKIRLINTVYCSRKNIKMNKFINNITLTKKDLDQLENKWRNYAMSSMQLQFF